MGGVFALGILALMVLFVCLTLFGAVCLVLALVFGLVYRGKVRKQKQNAGEKIRTVWKVMPWVFLAAGLLSVYPAAWVAHSLSDPVNQLTDAVLYDDYDKAAALLESGVDPDSGAGSGGEFTLLCALADDGLMQTRKGDASQRKLAYERLLLEHGADVNHRVKVPIRSNELPHSSAEAKNPSWKTGAKHECGKTPLLLAAKNGDLASMKLFVEYGADINAVDDCGYNAVLIAAQLLNDTQGGAEVLQYLLDNGCDAEAQTHFGQNALALIDQYQDGDQDAMRSVLINVVP
ncbi:MAG: ankyrin repeat domain-containing protein [Clostridia bacterium]|nr:ankyrin repeat domain-containing protein [Clostridia bacterium]